MKLNSKIDKLKEKIKAETGVNKVDLLNELAYESHKLNPKETWDSSKKALLLSKKLHYNEGIAKSLYLLGIYYYLESKYDLALTFYNKSLIMYYTLESSFENFSDRGKVKSYIGGVHEKRGDIIQ